MSILQTQAQIQQHLFDMQNNLHHLYHLVRAINPSISERTLHDQVTVRAKEVVAMSENLEWLLHKSECCE